MKLTKCFFCNKITYTPFHVTEINKDGTTEACHMCEKCAAQYLTDYNDATAKIGNAEMTQVADLTHINTPEELLDFLSNLEGQRPSKEPCACGLTEEEFDKTGRFGCPECYVHFKDKLEELVFPYHGARGHIGKMPRTLLARKWQSSPEERLKLLRLQYAKALEIEDYERAAEIKKELDQIK